MMVVIELIYPDHKVLNVPLNVVGLDEPFILINKNVLFFFLFRKMKATRLLGIIFNKATDNFPLSSSLTDVRINENQRVYIYIYSIIIIIFFSLIRISRLNA
jgi:hypothetical protein